MSAPRPDYISERNWTIYGLVRAGQSYAAIARHYGITRQRVRQLATITEFRLACPPRRPTGPRRIDWRDPPRQFPSIYEQAVRWKREQTAQEQA